MRIEKINVKGFKIYRDFSLDIKNQNNILVGDNGSGKSTLLDAINLAITGRLNGKAIEEQLAPNIFNQTNRNNYICGLNSGKPTNLPKIIIELYYADIDELARYKGKNNSLSLDKPGIRVAIEFDSKFQKDYTSRLQDQNKLDNLRIEDIPTEYYTVSRNYFNSDPVLQRSNPFKSFFVDGTKKSYANYLGRYIYSNIGDGLSIVEKTQIQAVYESIRRQLRDDNVLQKFNKENLQNLKVGELSVSLSVRQSLPEDWLHEITVNVESMPFDDIGFGLQKMIQMELAVNNFRDQDGTLLFEEPENNLSYTNMSSLINIIESNDEKQKFITTHNSFVANKMGLNNLLLCEEGKIEPFSAISKGDFDYFKKMPGYDTLRLVLAKRVVLVEGPTDELIFDKAFLEKYKCMPIEKGVDVIVVDSLAFKRYLDILSLIEKPGTILTDNDGDISNLKKKYRDYMSNKSFKFYYETNEQLNTIEPSLVSANKDVLEELNSIINPHNKIDTPTDMTPTASQLIKFMTNNKSEWALRVFNSEKHIGYPDYILEAVQHAID